MLADKVGVTDDLSSALISGNAVHDRGRVFTDLAVTIAGGTSISDIEVLRNQKRIFGSVASTATAWRTLDEIDAGALAQSTVVRNQVRENSSNRTAKETYALVIQGRLRISLADFRGVTISANAWRSYREPVMLAPMPPQIILRSSMPPMPPMPPMPRSPKSTGTDC